MIPNILVVERDPHVRELICSYLETNNFRTFRTSTGEECLHRIKLMTVSLVVLECELDGDDYTTLRKIKSDPLSPPVLLLTRSALDDSRQRIIQEIGADDFMSKFLTLDELLLAVKKLLKPIETS